MTSVLQEALDITSGDRQAAYGHPLINFIRLSIMSKPLLENVLHPTAYITPRQIAELFGPLLKSVRGIETFKWDNAVDTAGYAQAIGRMHLTMLALGFDAGLAWFDQASFNDVVALYGVLLTGKIGTTELVKLETGQSTLKDYPDFKFHLTTWQATLAE